jgi:hypothetical protein
MFQRNKGCLKRKLSVWLVLSLLLPFVVGFVEPPYAEIEPVVSQKTVLFPEGPLFFASLASTKEPRTHVTWLSLKVPADTFNIGSVGYGDSFGLMRWGGWGDDDAWQIGLSGAVLAQFNMDTESMDLINADYIIGFPLEYRNGDWSTRLRIFHQSSHLGDEYLLHPQSPELRQDRINLSFETVELLTGWDWNGLRITAGSSYIVHTYTPLERLRVQAGIDYLRTKPVFKPTMHPFASVLYHAWEETDWQPDISVKLGINIRSPYTENRAIQVFAEYYHGNLPFGQFYKLRAEYYGAGINVSF